MRRVAVLTALPALARVAASFAQPASARTSGISVARSGGGTIIRLAANQSGNWSGYNQGTLEHADHKQFKAIAGDCTVPTATAHKANEAEYSSTWVGIGGGCIDAGCTASDNTLIQAGTEQMSTPPARPATPPGGKSSPVVHTNHHAHDPPRRSHAGHHRRRRDSRSVDHHRRRSHHQEVVHDRPDILVEPPDRRVDCGAASRHRLRGVGRRGRAAQPDSAKIDKSMVNGEPVQLKTSEEMQLVSNGTVLATPSAPDPALPLPLPRSGRRRSYVARHESGSTLAWELLCVTEPHRCMG